MAGSDPFDDYFAQATGSKGGNAAPVPQARGWIDTISDTINRFDPDWFPEASKHDTRLSDRLVTSGYPTLGKGAAWLTGFGEGVGDAAFGGPLRAVGSAATLLTAGGSRWLPAGVKYGGKALSALESYLPKAAPVAAKYGPKVAKGIYDTSRAVDVATAGSNILQGAQDVGQGNYRDAAIKFGLGGLAGYGAKQSYGSALADAMPKPKETAIQELHRIAAEQRAAQGKVKPPTWEDIGTKLDRLATGGAADRNVVRESYTQRGTPTAITDESRLLTTGTEPLINRPRGGTGTAVIGKHPVNRAGDVDLNRVDYTDANLTERAVRDFDALGIAETNDRILRYLQDPKYREKIELAVAQGKTSATPRIIEHNVLDDFMRPIGKREFTPEQKAAEFKKLRELEEEYFTTDPEDMADRLMAPTDTEIEGKKFVASRLTPEKIDELQDLGLVSRTEAAELRMHKAGLDPEGMDMTIDQPMKAQVPWDSPAGGYTGTVGEVRPGTSPTMKPSRTLFKRSHNVIDEMAADSPNNTGYFPRTTHMAVEDKYVDEFGQNLTRRELPEGEKIFDIKRGLSDEQIKEVTDFVEARGVQVDSAQLHVLRTETGPRLSGVLTEIMTKKGNVSIADAIPQELTAKIEQLNDKWRGAVYNNRGTFTAADEAQLDALNKERTRLAVEANKSNQLPTGFRDFMKEKGYFATNYKGISGEETIAGALPQEGFAIVDPSNLPRTKTVERGGTPPRVGGRMVDEQGNPIRTQADRPVVAPEAKTPAAVKAKLLRIFRETKGGEKGSYEAGLRAGLTDAELELAGANKILGSDMVSRLMSMGRTAPGPRISGPAVQDKIAKMTFAPGEEGIRGYVSALRRTLTDAELQLARENSFTDVKLIDEALAMRTGTGADTTGKTMPWETAEAKAVPTQAIPNTPPPVANRPVLPENARWEQGPTQTMVAPPNTTRPVNRSMDDVRQAMIARGMTPTDEFVRQVFNDPKLLDKVVPPRSVSEGVSAEGRHVFSGETLEEGVQPLRGLLNSANPEDIRFRKALEDKSNEFLKLIHHTDEIGTKLNKAKEIIGDSEFGAIIDRVKTTQDGWAKKFVKGMGMSMETELERMGPGGKAVAHLFKLAATDAPIRFNEYMKGIDVELRKMKHVDFERVVDALEGKKVELTPELENFKTRLEGVLKVSGQQMEEHGLLEKGLRQNYFPHRYDGVPTETLRQKMRDDGMTEDQVSKALKDIQEHRELKISGEFSRNDLNIPGYRKDKDVLIDHLRETAKRVEHAKRFGAKDIADPNSQLSRFVNASENPQRAKDLSDRILRGGRQVSPESMMASKAIRNYATAAHLSLASISQLGGAVPIAMRTSMKETLMGLGKALREDPNSKFMKNVNYARDFATHWNDGAKGDMLYKAFGIQGVQNYMNKVAGQAGYAHAQTLFSGLQKDPMNKLARKQLEDLTLTPIAEVLKQPQLTEHQLQRAMTRMAEISQGTAEAKNLPYHWVGNGTRLIPQIFQRMAFQGTKAIKDGLMEGDLQNRLKKLGVLGITGMVAGEVIGDVKEIPKTAAEVGTNTISQALGYTTDNKDLFTTDWANNEYLQNIGVQPDEDNDRFGYTRKMVGQVSPEAGKDENIVRGISNLMNSYATGMPGDMLLQVSEAMNDRRPLNAMMSGFWAWDELNTAAESGKKLSQGNWRDPLRQGVRRFPVVGSGIVREIDTDFQAGGGGNSGKPTIKSGSW